MGFKVDCLYFTGFKPCEEHKKNKQQCDGCKAYHPINHRILVIKTGAAGDVIRTTPILHRLKQTYPNSEISWITLYPDLVPKSHVHRILKFSWENTQALLAEKFDLLINLDKSIPEAALANQVHAKEKLGFLLSEQGKIIPANKNAEEKWSTGVDDLLMKKNQKHFIEENFDVCGWTFGGEKYILDEVPQWTGPLPIKKPLIGLNTGCGERWLTRLWPEHYYEELAAKLISMGYGVMLLCGPQEEERNIRISKATGAYFPGIFDLKTFASLINECDAIVTSVTMALHMAIALEKKIVLFNNIFPTNEFHLYGHGEILEPNLSCQGCYKNDFDSSCPANPCTSLITPDKVITTLEKLLSQHIKSETVFRRGT